MSRVKKRWKTFAHVTESENLGYMWLLFFFFCFSPQQEAIK